MTAFAPRTILVLAGLGLGLAGCATQPTDSAALTQARQDYSLAAANPQVAGNAPLQLRDAEQALRRAEALRDQGADAAEVDHQAYIASRRVQIAQETAGVKGAPISSPDAVTISASGVTLLPCTWIAAMTSAAGSTRAAP